MGRWTFGFAVGAVAFAFAAGSATAAVPFVDIGTPGGPLINVSIGNDLSCQVKHTGDSQLEFYPPAATPGDCGTFLAVGGTLYTPDFSNHQGTATGGLGPRTPFSAVSQTPRSGAGTSGNPFRTVTTANAGGTGLTLTQTDTYVSGQESYRTDTVVRNGGGAPQTIVLYRAGDCYLQESDSGFGFVLGGAPGCSANANNSPPGRIEQFVPITPGSAFLENNYNEVWQAIGTKTMFPNQCAQCTNRVDNGAGISWTATIQPGQSVTFSHFTTFSPTGRTGPPSTSPDIDQARTPRCLSVPAVTRNVIRNERGLGTFVLRTNQVGNPAFPLRLSLAIPTAALRAARIASITWQVNGRTVTGISSTARTLNVPVSRLRIGGRFRNQVTAIIRLTTGRVVRITQFLVILRCAVPAVTCQRLGPTNTRMRCTSRTPLSGVRVGVTVTRSASETARGSARVVRGRYTVIVTSRTALGAGTYAYKHVVTTNVRGVRFQMIRLVTVR
jgi:hypothetical protein